MSISQKFELADRFQASRIDDGTQFRISTYLRGGNVLTGTVTDLAGRFDAAPDDFLASVGGLISAGWVTVEINAGGSFRIQLQD